MHVAFNTNLILIHTKEWNFLFCYKVYEREFVTTKMYYQTLFHANHEVLQSLHFLYFEVQVVRLPFHLAVWVVHFQLSSLQVVHPQPPLL